MVVRSCSTFWIYYFISSIYYNKLYSIHFIDFYFSIITITPLFIINKDTIHDLIQHNTTFINIYNLYIYNYWLHFTIIYFLLLFSYYYSIYISIYFSPLFIFTDLQSMISSIYNFHLQHYKLLFIKFLFRQFDNNVEWYSTTYTTSIQLLLLQLHYTT